MKIFQKINKFYVFLVLVLMVLSVFLAYTLNTVFSSISKAGEIDKTLLEATSPRLDKTKIDEALGVIDQRQFTPLDL
jgi:hypothetical protein